MKIDIELKNFRCFEDSAPAQFTLQPGFTALVGMNNSGKSTVLRFLYEFRSMFQVLRDHGPGHLVSAMRSVCAFTLPGGLPSAEPLFCDTNERGITVTLRIDDPSEPSDLVPKRLEFVIDRNSNSFRLRVFGHDGVEADTANGFNADGAVLVVGGIGVARIDWLKSVLQILSDTLYIGSFRNVIPVGGGGFYDIQVGQAFVSQWRNWQAGGVKSKGRAIYALTAEVQRIFGFRELQIHSSEDGTTLLLSVDGRQYGLSELGSGLAQFILVLATAAIRRPSYILIDEPELSLHASLQSDFLQTLTAYSSEGVVFATHSLGLARTVADTIYSVVRSDGRSRLVPYDATPRLAEFIGAMSFAGKPDLGFDRVLLVEGTTDGRAIQQFLRRLGKDHQVLPIPLGGATLIKGGDETETQLTELKRITPHISALIDSERTSADAALDPSREGFRNLCLRVGVVCHVLERRALENYFTPEAVERALGPGHLELGHFGSLKRGQGGWSKQQNWRIAGEMTLADLKGTDLLDALNAI